MTHAISNIIDLTNAPTPPIWFEFVFEPDRLEQHLDLSPLELISSFFKNIPELDATTSSPNAAQSGTSNGLGSTNGLSDNGELNELRDIINQPCVTVIPPGSYEAKYRLKKTYALQTLALKVASHLKWNLDALGDGLTIPIQFKLLQALKKACQHENCPDEVKMFATVIYCRWFLRSEIAYKLSAQQPQSNNTTIIYLSPLQKQQQIADSLALGDMGDLFSEKTNLKSCVNELHDYIWRLMHNKDNTTKKLKTTNHPFKKAKLSRPKMECFDALDEENNNWNECEPIESIEFIESACYDLGRSLFFDEQYSQAKEVFEIIKNSKDEFPLLESFLQSASNILTVDDKPADEDEDDHISDNDQSDVRSTNRFTGNCDKLTNENSRKRQQTEKYLFDCMNQFSKSQVEKNVTQCVNDATDDIEEDIDMRFEIQGPSHQRLPENSAWYLQVPVDQQQQQLLELGKGDLFMSRGNFKQAMGCFVGALMLVTDYFRQFSKNYVDEEPYITRMIQCSISLSCFTQAVALCQMTKSLNYTIAFKQLNERVCNDCCDDIYECIWNVTLLEYIINLHARRGEVERRTKVIQLIGQLELNENNPEDILREAEHVRRGRFFRIMSNKYL